MIDANPAALTRFPPRPVMPTPPGIAYTDTTAHDGRYAGQSRYSSYIRQFRLDGTFAKPGGSRTDGSSYAHGVTDTRPLGEATYLLLTTYRKDGRAVPTPVWVVPDGDALAVWTTTDSGKVKRIRRRPEVTVAPCDIRGNPRGEAVPARAVIGDAGYTERVRALIRRKYGLLGRITLFGSRLRRGLAGTVGIHITIPPAVG
jgi:PPOX class probable F420-dependent enzyme